MLGLATALNSSSLKKKSALTNKFSAELDGTGDYIDVSSLSSDLNRTAGTISMWIRVQATASNESFFNCSAGTSSDNKISIIYNTSSAKIQANYKSGGTDMVADHAIAGDDLTGLGWFHLAMTYNTSTPLIQLFLNGTRVAQRTSSITAISEDVAIDRIRLGSNSNADNTYHNGNIDEFIYIAGKDLTETEMLLLYNNGKPDDIGDLPTAIYNAIKCWLRFGDGIAGGTLDSITGVVDMSNGSLGSEIIANNDFSVNETADQANLVGGIQFNSWNESPSSGSATFTSITNGYRRTAVTATDQVWQQRIYQNISSSLDIGSIYRFTFTIVSSIDATFAARIQQLGSTNIQSPSTATTVLTANVPVTINEYFVCTNNTNQYVDIWPSNKLMTAGQYYELSDISLTKVQGNPGFSVANATVGNANVP